MSDVSAQDLAFMRHALDLATCAENDGEVPVGALVVLNGEIIGEMTGAAPRAAIEEAILRRLDVQ